MGSEREDERAVLAGGRFRCILLRVLSWRFFLSGMVGCVSALLRRIGTRCGSGGGVAASGGCDRNQAVCLVPCHDAPLVVYAQVSYELYECPVGRGAGCDAAREGRPVDGTLWCKGEGFLETASAEEVVAVGSLDGVHEGAAAVAGMERRVSRGRREVGKRERERAGVPADGTLECSGDWIDIVIVVHVTHGAQVSLCRWERETVLQPRERRRPRLLVRSHSLTRRG